MRNIKLIDKNKRLLLVIADVITSVSDLLAGFLGFKNPVPQNFEERGF